MSGVYSKRRGDAPAGAVYVGRPSKFGNPFQIGRDGDREAVIEQYRIWFYSAGNEALRRSARRELTGHDLVCWCSPEPCHAEILLDYVEKTRAAERPWFSGLDYRTAKMK